MHRASQIRNDMSDALDFGWEFNKEGVTHNWERMVSQVQSYIKSLNFGYRKMLMENNVKYFNSFGSFVDKHTLKLKTDTTESQITARNFVIATGGRPKYPDVPGAKQLCITSDDLFSMKNRPGKVLVIGASYVALECAGFLNGLGYDTTVMVRSILLRGFDQQMAARIEDHMTSCGVKFIKNTVPTLFKKDEKTGAIATSGETNGKKTFSGAFDTVLLAIGREACTGKLNLEGIGVKINPTSKKVIVDEKERTSVPTIFAIGDVADGKPELTPVAIQAGQLLAKRLFNMSTLLMDYKNVPTSVFTPCEYGCVGFTEEDAILKHGAKIEVYHQEFAYLEGVMTERAPKSYVKLIVLKEDKEEYVIGAHIFCPNAGEIIQGFALGIKMGAKKKDFNELVGIHPTVAEIFTTLNVTKSSGKNAEATGC
uniref:thioredoxin-disulfide reductase (NADPH) n=1 Tax=Lygus hesperus TaxID=30085 RepID=A0A0A9X5F0_LYGHE